MIDGMPMVDVHLHAARRPTLKLERSVWAPLAGMPFEELYDADGTLQPDRFDAYLADEGVDIALLMMPPQRLPQYYANYDLRRLARKFIFGSDWPGVPGIVVNARAVTKLDLGDEDDLRRVMAGNALEVYTGLELPAPADIDRPVR